MRLRRQGPGDADVTPSGQPVVGDIEPVNDSDRRWAAKAQQLELEALPNIRSAAEKWAASLTGLLGVVGLAAVIEGADVFDALKNPWEIAGQLTFFGAAVAALIASGFAIWAAVEVTPKVFLPGGDALRATAKKAVENAVFRLAVSRIVAGVAVVLVLASAACLWWGAEDASKPKVIDGTGTALCGAGSAPAPAAPKDAAFALRCSR